MIESPVTPYEIKRAEYTVILAEKQMKKQRTHEDFLEKMWKDVLRRYS